MAEQPKHATRRVLRDVFPVTDKYDVSIPGLLNVLHVAPLRSLEHIASARAEELIRPGFNHVDDFYELWYEVSDFHTDYNYDLSLYVEGTGHTITHDGKHIGTFPADNQHLIWHVYAEYNGRWANGHNESV
ncbi:hypothetical protein SEA_SIXAMA_189 [Gordonia phage Sixama]|uniref:DUF7352 domain-containing protein n=1 Tax=Gordonia phage Sixama TaxID=2653271 RepID=A0A5Q2F1D5_9CAUD|nr:hypothetical protein PP302_gp140 [Gordonia phage Sixama]QGF20339.1 hypothetical protein SEA_SIXAMA_189 [Gordonia phage Sixama]